MKKTALLLAIIFALAICASCVTNSELASYNAGVRAYDEHNYALAKAYFTAAEGYGNSGSYLSAIAEFERIYLEAVAFVESRDYEAARNDFAAIEDFENSGEFIAFIDRLYARYDEGTAAFESEDYPLAKMRFIQSMGVRDADEYVKRISKLEDAYRTARGYYEEGNYPEALEACRKIGANYKDTNDMIAELERLIMLRGVTPAQLMELYFTGSNKAGDTVTLASADITENGFAATTSDEVLMTGNTDKEGFITSVSFWVSDKKAKELGADRLQRIYAHLMRALGANAEEFDSVLERAEELISGSGRCGGYVFSTRHDPSGFMVLTAERKGE